MWQTCVHHYVIESAQTFDKKCNLSKSHQVIKLACFSDSRLHYMKVGVRMSVVTHVMLQSVYQSNNSSFCSFDTQAAQRRTLQLLLQRVLKSRLALARAFWFNLVCCNNMTNANKASLKTVLELNTQQSLTHLALTVNAERLIAVVPLLLYLWICFCEFNPCKKSNILMNFVAKVYLEFDSYLLKIRLRNVGHCRSRWPRSQLGKGSQPNSCIWFGVHKSHSSKHWPAWRAI